VDVEPTIERSRSGNGGHVWLFFTESVTAADARRLGFYILTETMARGAALSVASYDRLFPSQDVLPNGGFGNLLASVPKIAPDRLAELNAASDADRVGALCRATDRPELPWRPSRTLADRLRGTPMPDKVHTTFAERLYIDRTGLSPALVDATRRLATFPNPVFMCLDDLRALPAEFDIAIDLDDQRIDGEPLVIEFAGELNASQTRALGCTA
jgi:hypothetical protein